MAETSSAGERLLGESTQSHSEVTEVKQDRGRAREIEHVLGCVRPTPQLARSVSPSIATMFRAADKLDRTLLAVGFVFAAFTGAIVPYWGMFFKNVSLVLMQEKGCRPIAKTLTICGCLAVGVFISFFISMSCFGWVANNMTRKLRLRSLDHLLHKAIGWYDTHPTGEMATQIMQDTYDFKQGVGCKLSGLVGGAFQVPTGILLAFVFGKSWKLTLTVMGLVSCLILCVGVQASTLQAKILGQQSLYAKAGAVAESCISSIRTVAAFNGQGRELAKYEEAIAEAQRLGVRSGVGLGAMMALSNFTMFAVFGLANWIGVRLALADIDNHCVTEKNNCIPDQHECPDFDACNCFQTLDITPIIMTVLMAMLGLIMALVDVPQFMKARAAAARIWDLLDDSPVAEVPSGERIALIHGRIEFTNVCFSYPTRLEQLAMNNMTFVVPAETTAAFVGPSGSGKSTSINLIMRFYDMHSGSICLDGSNIRNLELHWLREQMALVQQEPVLFGCSIKENISFGKSGATEHEIIEAARAANAEAFIVQFPDGYDTMVGERGTQMSGGQKQRIAIARALVRNPRILLLDEATSALDVESERVVQEALDRILATQRRTTLVVAHRLTTIMNANVIFVMDGGRLVESGTHEELCHKTDSLYAQLVRLQTLSSGSTETAFTDNAQSLLLPLEARGCAESSDSFTRQASMGMGDVVDFVRSFTSSLSKTMSEQQEETSSEKLPAEDEEYIKVPVRRLLKLQGQVMWLIVPAVIASLAVGAANPLQGELLASVNEKIARPSVLIDRYANLRHEVIANSKTLLWDEIMIGASMSVAAMIQQFGFAVSAEHLARKIRSLTLRAMLRQEIAYFDKRPTGHLTSRLAEEAPKIRSFTGESLAAMVQLVGVLVTALYFSISASALLSLALLSVIPFMVICDRLIHQAQFQGNAATNESGTLVADSLMNVKTVAAFNLQSDIIKRFEVVLTTEWGGANKEVTALSFSIGFMWFSLYGMFGVMTGLGPVFIDEGNLTAKGAFHCLLPLLFCVSGMTQAMQFMGDKDAGQKAVNHIFATLDRVPAIDSYQDDGRRLENVTGAIEFVHIIFRYPARPDVVVFNDFHLTIEPSSTVAFCGPSGSGKSTTINLLMRFYDPESGFVSLDGCDIRQLNLQWLRDQMAIVQQEPVLFGGDIFDNIRYGKPSASDDECILAARLANAHNFVNESLPKGYRTDVGDRGGALSGGQKQRIAIARAIIRKPAVLLLDEATSALDSESERLVQDALDVVAHNARCTTLVVAHRLSTIVGADMICVIYEGKIVEKGTHAELMCLNGEYKKLAARSRE
eukprot:TRINITY_DN43959_c0_g1_i1.p1 TRINITY_DN43959_c0_g1~~TRINITY_DN43959_c0_g1_i1.p1  ORF type:complete len:1322 (-),score=230.81 TRINITY_DN43959_c0_g1_i1:92-4057(-)